LRLANRVRNVCDPQAGLLRVRAAARPGRQADHDVDAAPEHSLEHFDVDVCGVADCDFDASRVQEADRDGEHATRDLERQESCRPRVEGVADQIDIAEAGLLREGGGELALEEPTPGQGASRRGACR